MHGNKFGHINRDYMRPYCLYLRAISKQLLNFHGRVGLIIRSFNDE